MTVQRMGLPDWTLAAVPFLFIYAPVGLCAWRKVDSYAYRIAIPAFSDGKAWGEALWLVAKVVALILIPWLAAYHVWQNFVVLAIKAHKLGVLDPLFTGSLLDTVTPRFRLPKDWLLLVPYHLFFVAIPEEFFYRGYFQTRLNEVFPRKFLVFGVPIGWGLVIASLFFAFGHSLVTVRWWHFATFFPGLLFGWLRERSGGTLAGALMHAWSNVTVVCLDTWYGVIP
ncbi:MAG: myxosortase family intramembrane protease [Myxococcota bacterium]